MIHIAKKELKFPFSLECSQYTYISETDTASALVKPIPSAKIFSTLLMELKS